MRPLEGTTAVHFFLRCRPAHFLSDLRPAVLPYVSVSVSCYAFIISNLVWPALPPHGHWWYCYLWSVTVSFRRNMHEMEDCVLKALSVYICVSGVEHGRTSSLVPFVAFPEFIVVMLCFYFIWWKMGVGGVTASLHSFIRTSHSVNSLQYRVKYSHIHFRLKYHQ